MFCIFGLDSVRLVGRGLCLLVEIIGMVDGAVTRLELEGIAIALGINTRGSHD